MSSRNSANAKIESSPTFDSNIMLPIQLLCLEIHLKSHPEGGGKLLFDEYLGYHCNKSVYDEYNQYLSLKNVMIQTLFINMRSDNGYVFGGYLRDQNADIEFNDIDIRFADAVSANNFIESLQEIYNVLIVSQHYYGCCSIRVQSKVLRYSYVDVDVTFETGRRNRFDLDVNMLASRDPEKELTIYNHRCTIHNILKNIRQRKFIALDKHGSPSLEHHLNSCYVAIGDSDQLTFIFSTVIAGDQNSCTCIHRRSYRGRKILQRIWKMEKRGWTCVNKTCLNPECILAQPNLPQLFARYKRAINKKRAYLHAALRRKILRRKTLGKKQLIVQLACLTGKNFNITNFGKKEKPRQLEYYKLGKIRDKNHPTLPLRKKHGRGRISSKKNQLDVYF